MEATAIGRNSGISNSSATSATNRPLLVIWLTKLPASSPPPPPPGGFTLTAIVSTIGTTASTASPTQLRRRPKINHSSERKNRVEKKGGATTPSTADIETLPREAHERLFQVRGDDLETPHGYARVHQRGDHLLRGGLAEQCGH